MLLTTTAAPAATTRPARRSRVIRWTVAGIWMAVIFGASSLRGSQVPGGFSTPAHFVEYAVLGTLAYAALRVDLSVSRSAVLAVAISSAYAVTDELHQAFVPGRMPDIADWAVDTAGALTAVACIMLVARLLRKQR